MPAFDSNRSGTDGASPGAIAELYVVDPGQSLGEIGGLPAFAATDLSHQRAGLMAIRSPWHLPPRALAMTALAAAPVEGVLCPVAHGAAIGPDGMAALFTIYPVPPGERLGQDGSPAWNEADLLGVLLRPVAATLDRLQKIGLTHRAIRVGNLFRSRRGDAVVLGPAWSAPTGCFQPALYEPPYAAMCHSSGRGEGSVADDVYALGVALVVLALGRDPMAGLSDDAIIRRKLELGSFAAIVGDARLSPGIADLARAMLAEDPDHRPTPASLSDPAVARNRRVAARVPRRAQRSLEVGGLPIWTARSLAYALAAAPDEGLQQLRDSSIDRWVRRCLDDPMLAVRLDEAIRRRGADVKGGERADSLLMLRAITLLDPLAPLHWRGLTFWPEGLGALMAATAADPEERQAALRDVIDSEASMTWAAMQGERVDAIQARLASYRQLMWMRQRGWGGGLTRLLYGLNPMLSCASPILSGQLVIRLDDLLPALNRSAGRMEPPNPAGPGPIDAHVGAFMAARHEHRIDGDLLAIGEARDAPLVQLRLLAGLQQRLRQPGMPALAAWLGVQAAPRLVALHGRVRRAAATAELEVLTRSGDLVAMLALMDDLNGQAEDVAGAEVARREAMGIDASLIWLAGQTAERARAARRWAHELTMSAGFVAVAALALAAVLD